MSAPGGCCKFQLPTSLQMYQILMTCHPHHWSSSSSFLFSLEAVAMRLVWSTYWCWLERWAKSSQVNIGFHQKVSLKKKRWFEFHLNVSYVRAFKVPFPFHWSILQGLSNVDVIIYSSAISACTLVGEWTQALQLLGDMDQRLWRSQVESRLWKSTVDRGLWVKQTLGFETMKGAKCLNHPSTSVTIHLSIACSFATATLRMQAVASWHILLQCCASWLHVEEGPLTVQWSRSKDQRMWQSRKMDRGIDTAGKRLATEVTSWYLAVRMSKVNVPECDCPPWVMHVMPIL